MHIVSNVAAEFRGPDHSLLYTVTPEERFRIIEVPDAIREDPQFAWMLADRSLSIAENAGIRKILEQGPGEDTGADGRSIALLEAAEAAIESKASTRKKTV